MKIGELATETGTAVETIRFYEREGLIAEPGRTDANYRIYGDEHAQRLTFIRRCRSLDMTLEEIRALLRFKDAPGDDCGDVNSLLDEHIGHVAHRIEELKVLQQQLQILRMECGSIESGAECGILKELSSTAPGALSVAAQKGSRGGVHSHGSPVHGRPARVR
ncbi:Cd(II)/Pb(II)-responsive transcriptional regulator [soil metagenome]